MLEQILVSNSSNLIDKRIFLFEKDPQFLIIEYVAKLKLLEKYIYWEKKKHANILKYSSEKKISEKRKRWQYFEIFWCSNKKYVVPSLETIQQITELYQHKGIDMIKFGWTVLFCIANICLHKSTDYKFYSFFFRSVITCLVKNGSMISGPTSIFTRKAVANETYNRKSINLSKSNVRIDPIQLYPCSICHDVIRGLCARWDYKYETKV